MQSLLLQDITEYVEQHIPDFHKRRLESLNNLKLTTVLKRKNPYLFRAKNMVGATQIVGAIVDAHISSNEETLFGNWLEGLAIFINSRVFGGWKSGIEGIDLEFDHDGVRYIVAIKSGPNWGNSGQIKGMVADFAAAKRTLRTSNVRINVVAVNGCCYGKDTQPLKKQDYYRYCGQDFWRFISDNDTLFTDIIEPLSYKAKERNDEFLALYHGKLTVLTAQFAHDFCFDNGLVDWIKLLRFNSGSAPNA